MIVFKRFIWVVLLVSQVSSCGYVLYPERQGQTGGEIDPAVVIGDAIGLLLGVLPGVVAFAVDYTNGTIYLPPGGKSIFHRDAKLKDLQAVPVVNKGEVLNKDAVAEALSKYLGAPVDVELLQFYGMSAVDHLSATEVALETSQFDSRHFY